MNSQCSEYLGKRARNGALKQQVKEVERGVVAGGRLTEGVGVVRMSGHADIAGGYIETRHLRTGHEYVWIYYFLNHHVFRPSRSAEAVCLLLSGLLRAVGAVVVLVIRGDGAVGRDGGCATVVKGVLEGA